eukprot:TRINITY_DN6343_c0_g1_i1.p1 TRINITY_DN6343_c0_g1~~TRINITY_DN6343_c0_g1_i1.p1  ORF type:complete len:132 (+),score=21.63 TRINITY_DN6343_c0_g1_i1:87-482(+)
MAHAAKLRPGVFEEDHAGISEESARYRGAVHGTRTRGSSRSKLNGRGRALHTYVDAVMVSAAFLLALSVCIYFALRRRVRSKGDPVGMDFAGVADSGPTSPQARVAPRACAAGAQPRHRAAAVQLRRGERP